MKAVASWAVLFRVSVSPWLIFGRRGVVAEGEECEEDEDGGEEAHVEVVPDHGEIVAGRWWRFAMGVAIGGKGARPVGWLGSRMCKKSGGASGWGSSLEGVFLPGLAPRPLQMGATLQACCAGAGARCRPGLAPCRLQKGGTLRMHVVAVRARMWVWALWKGFLACVALFGVDWSCHWRWC